jgi:beta-lactamase regulating signal transducer with metallopeptidase domain
MSLQLATVWQYNVEFTILLVVILLARFLVRKTTRVYNAYLLWASIPLGLFLGGLVSLIEFRQPPMASVNVIVTEYVVAPAAALQQQHNPIGQIWLMVAVALMVRLAVQHRQLRRQLASIRVPIELPFKSRYRVVGIDKTDFSPAVYGFLTPTIYFPTHLLSQLSAEQIRLIVAHEEQHIRQCHLWLNLLWDLVVCALWFNPLVYLGRQCFRHDQELFCDYLVLNRTAPRQHQSYGHALLTTVSATHSVSLLCSWKSFNQLEERIMNIRKSTSHTARFLITLASGLIVAATSVYAASVDGDQNETRSVHQILDDETGERSITVNINGKVMQEKNGERFVPQKDGRRPLTDRENTAFDDALAYRPSTPAAPPAPAQMGVGQESIHVEKNDQGDETIMWYKDGLVFTQKNEHRYVLDDGQQRELTPEEATEFEATIAEVKENLKDRPLAPRAEQRERIIQIEIDEKKQQSKREMIKARALAETRQRAFERRHEAQQQAREFAHQQRIELAHMKTVAQQEYRVRRAQELAHERQVMRTVAAKVAAKPHVAPQPVATPEPVIVAPVSSLSKGLDVAPLFDSESVPN